MSDLQCQTCQRGKGVASSSGLARLSLTEFRANFVLQAVNAQALGMRLEKEGLDK